MITRRVQFATLALLAIVLFVLALPPILAAPPTTDGCPPMPPYPWPYPPPISCCEAPIYTGPPRPTPPATPFYEPIRGRWQP